MQPGETIYLGDGAYLHCEGDGYALLANSADNPTDVVHLDREVLAAFLAAVGAEQPATAANRIAELESALEAIVNHQKTVGGGMASLSATKLIAERALSRSVATETKPDSQSEGSACSDAILSDREIIEHHEAVGANFGSTSPVHVVQQGLLKAACGWHNGSTCNAILRHHGLTEERYDGTCQLTHKGRRYLWETFKDALGVVI